ncbi:uncharacterized protein BO66DRAFT_74886 [Aspergillus aculeatinus CBS 121060]|uniref:Uncharacterized protein n=1 Tax=Aspergillus aculeatinus CBS 121060 TaxID=1448322 RepID=A0ACD1HBZ3_9EURO|nr:hypothetical protein BO66DRAFT_74886 [Aspergillus aculeatinus CBS 121060]RAH70927.1 hypothetical protein BO66DRAFT_74886 [Aspergillus aculeatinus CBS 121060]
MFRELCALGMTNMHTTTISMNMHDQLLLDRKENWTTSSILSYLLLCILYHTADSILSCHHCQSFCSISFMIPFCIRSFHHLHPSLWNSLAMRRLLSGCVGLRTMSISLGTSSSGGPCCVYDCSFFHSMFIFAIPTFCSFSSSPSLIGHFTLLSSLFLPPYSR